MLSTIIAVGLAFLAALVVKAVLINAWVQITWKVFGWKPKLVRQDILNNTAMFCATTFVEHELANRPEMAANLTQEEKDNFREDMATYTRWAIEAYIEKYLTLGKVVPGDKRLPDPRITLVRS
jgi:hypothetical protein